MVTMTLFCCKMYRTNVRTFQIVVKAEDPMTWIKMGPLVLTTVLICEQFSRLSYKIDHANWAKDLWRFFVSFSSADSNFCFCLSTFLHKLSKKVKDIFLKVFYFISLFLKFIDNSKSRKAAAIFICYNRLSKKHPLNP